MHSEYTGKFRTILAHQNHIWTIKANTLPVVCQMDNLQIAD